jgi:universal stress protein A
MQAYRHILMSTDFGENSELIAQRAHDLAERYQAKLTLLHVIDYMPVADSAYGPAVPFDATLSEELLESAQRRLAGLAKSLGRSDADCRVEIGSPKVEIIRIAEESEVDLIVVGSHGKHGLQLLLGSTSSSVLHHTPCDVLAVRLKTP